MLDLPVARSAHNIPTPRGGGLAIATSVLLFMIFLVYMNTLSIKMFAVLLCAIPVAITGFIDDLKGLPVIIRLPVHLASAFAALWLLGPVPEPFFS
ncbi:MAG: glycosyl transferase family 4, partial [Pseudohongiella sp.]|nr:glycosyl transferase family 4 [Pseudohongiella sp.]